MTSLSPEARIELAEFQAGLMTEQQAEMRKAFQDLEHDLRARIHRLEKELAEQDDKINNTVVSVVTHRAGVPSPKIVLIRDLLEDYEGNLSWDRCSVPSCTDPKMCGLLGDGRHE